MNLFTFHPFTKSAVNAVKKEDRRGATSAILTRRKRLLALQTVLMEKKKRDECSELELLNFAEMWLLKEGLSYPTRRDYVETVGRILGFSW